MPPTTTGNSAGATPRLGLRQIGWRASCCSPNYIKPMRFTPSQMHSALPHEWITEAVYVVDVTVTSPDAV